MRRTLGALLAVVMWLALALPAPADAAVFITVTTRGLSLNDQDVTHVQGTVTAGAAMPSNCPKEFGDGSDGDTTCVYLETSILFVNPINGEWEPLVVVHGAGPEPTEKRIRINAPCGPPTWYRTFFAQLVRDPDGDEWVDRRWDEGLFLDCGVPRRPPTVEQAKQWVVYAI